ncbi:MAG: SPOR domain-containing protein [Candidatus Accumulibacter sp.]|uniref:SPOR domain-containing protein n=1 Tax=Accumulibacter sp. TaxID=2053492 RepID=UPI001A59D162|nr:hypothetical protein [Accumulibacter sp.]MBL8396062.1 SPOR domain-containing protein [Accumulibacter sp.]
MVGVASAVIERQLRRRLGLAGLLLVLLLGALPLVDSLLPSDDPVNTSTLFTEPVPVRRKDLAPAAPAVAPSVEAPAIVAAGAETTTGKHVAPPLTTAEPQASGAAIEPSPAAPATPPGGEPAVIPPATSGPAATATARPLAGPVLQSAVLPDLRRAEEAQARLAQAGIPASIELRLQAGPFKTRVEAEAARREMQKHGVETVILPARGAKQ